MGQIISFVGQKGGTGKSTLARAFAVEAAKTNSSVLIADLDDAQRTSCEWSERRAANSLLPQIKVELLPALEVFIRAADVDLLVADAPGWSDTSTVWLAKGSKLTVLPTGASVDDLNPTIRLTHELMNKGIADWRVALALCRIQTDAEAAFARDYLKQAGYEALQGTLREKKGYRDLQNVGHAVTESSNASLAQDAIQLVHSIGQALEHSLQREQELDREAKGPMHIKRSDQGREDR
jgi:chromosome partitioning protein